MGVGGRIGILIFPRYSRQRLCFGFCRGRVRFASQVLEGTYHQQQTQETEADIPSNSPGFLIGDIQKWTRGRGRHRNAINCRITLYDILWRYMTFYVKWRKQRRLSWNCATCRKMSQNGVNCREVSSWPSPSRRPLLDLIDLTTLSNKTVFPLRRLQNGTNLGHSLRIVFSECSPLLEKKGCCFLNEATRWFRIWGSEVEMPLSWETDQNRKGKSEKWSEDVCSGTPSTFCTLP